MFFFWKKKTKQNKEKLYLKTLNTDKCQIWTSNSKIFFIVFIYMSPCTQTYTHIHKRTSSTITTTVVGSNSNSNRIFTTFACVCQQIHQVRPVPFGEWIKSPKVKSKWVWFVVFCHFMSIHIIAFMCQSTSHRWSNFVKSLFGVTNLRKFEFL